jgi:hypothetical protein
VKRKAVSPLVEAAQAFDDALDEHARASELFVRSPLSSTKHLDRANELVGEIAAAEERLRERGAALAEAVAAARDRQEKSAQQIVERLPALQERNEQLRVLLAEFAALGSEAGAVSAGTSAGGPPTTAIARDLAAALAELAGRAEALSTRARTAGFDELANQVHSLHQRLLATSKKLQNATL